MSDGRLVEGLEWIVSPETESTQALLPYRGTQIAAVASASFGERLKGEEAVYALNVGTGLQSKSVLLALNQPESAYELGLAPDRWLYHPSDQITLSAELREAGAAMRVVSARAFLSLSDGGLSAQADVQAQPHCRPHSSTCSRRSANAPTDHAAFQRQWTTSHESAVAKY